MKEDQEQYDKDTDSFQNSTNENFQQIGEALKENNKDKLDQATDNIKQENNQTTDGAWKETISDLIEDLENIKQDSGISDEMKDIVSDYQEKLENALDKAEGEYDFETGEEIQAPDMPGAKEDVENATNEFNKDLSDFMEDFFGGQELGKDLMGNLSNAQNNLNGGQKPEDDQNQPGQQPEGDKQEGETDKGDKGDQESNNQEGESDKGDQETDSDKESDSESETGSESENGSSGGGQKPTVDKTTIYIPGYGEVSIEELVALGLLDAEFDKMFDKELTEEERQTIANYLDLIKK
jgi:clumping factor A